jgi:bifunctional non-homologous end joining protein LigD
MSDQRITVCFIEPMLLRSTPRLPSGPSFAYELKLDGFRAVTFKTGRRVLLRSRNNKDFNRTYPTLVQALAAMPDETLIDGEVVALDDAGRPSFNALQNYTSGSAPLVYYVFDVMILGGRNVMEEPLTTRRALLHSHVLSKLGGPIRESPELDAALPDLIATVRAHGLEGLVAKRRDSRYEPGQRSGAWLKMRVNRGQEFVIGGYTIGGNGFDAVIFGYYDGDKLVYAGRTRNGFTPASRVISYPAVSAIWRLRFVRSRTCQRRPAGVGVRGSQQRRWQTAGGSPPFLWRSSSSSSGPATATGAMSIL